MNDPLLMCRVHCAGQDFQHAGRLANWLRAAAERFFQRRTVDILQGQHRPAIVLLHGMDLDDVGMLELRNRFGLATKPRQSDGRTNLLQRDKSIQAQLSRLVDDSHPALSKTFEDLVVWQAG